MNFALPFSRRESVRSLAVVLAEAIWRLVSALTWYLIIPVIGKFLHGQTESVMFEAASNNPIHWDTLFGSLLEFVLLVIVVLFLNRWIRRDPTPPGGEEPVEPDPLRGSII